jgi:hypothetical protein
MLGQKEYFSDYVFEDIAADLLKTDPALRKSWMMKKPTQNWPPAPLHN